MPYGLERRQQTGQLHFITFSCSRRLAYLNNRTSKNTLEKVIEKARISYGIDIYAYVIMPEHIRLGGPLMDRFELIDRTRL